MKITQFYICLQAEQNALNVKVKKTVHVQYKREKQYTAKHECHDTRSAITISLKDGE